MLKDWEYVAISLSIAFGLGILIALFFLGRLASRGELFAQRIPTTNATSRSGSRSGLRQGPGRGTGGRRGGTSQKAPGNSRAPQGKKLGGKKTEQDLEMGIIEGEGNRQQVVVE